MNVYKDIFVLAKDAIMVKIMYYALSALSDDSAVLVLRAIVEQTEHEWDAQAAIDEQVRSN